VSQDKPTGSEERRKLQAAIREEVRYQDADISQDDLDILVSVHVWGDDKYELANFTDDELVP
jgi:regulatory protein YycI of two-component signal transduction system YycFG